jgi:23S rRNA pseudouridine1911/1915/1917 synthase
LILAEKFIVKKLDEKVRLSDLDISLFKTLSSKKALKKAIKNKRVFINNNQGFSGDYLFGGEAIDVIEDLNIKNKPVYNFKVEVLYEDDFFAVVNKPAGLSTSGNQFQNLENCLPFNISASLEEDALMRPLVIHRLDFATSGIVIIGKTQSATINLNKQFESRAVVKNYLAVTLNKMESPISITLPIDGKQAQSNCIVLKTLVSDKYNCINLVKVSPITGRRHQIRKHLNSIGHPICGDNIYNKKEKDIKGNGLYLHALSISFLHPETNERILFKTEMPKKMKRLFHQKNITSIQ